MLAQLCVGLLLPLGHGRPPAFWQMFRRLAHGLENKLNRNRRAGETRFSRGFASAALLALLGVGSGAIINAAATIEYGFVFVLLFLAITVTATTPIKVLRRMYQLLAEHNTSKAISFLQPLSGVNMADADRFALTRRAIEYAVLAFHRYLVAPVLFYLIGGAAAVSLYIAFAIWDRSAQYDDKRYFFSWMALRIQAVLDFIPTFFTCFLLTMAALFTPGGHPVQGIKVAARQIKTDRSFGLRTLLAMGAGNLGVTLCGPTRYTNGVLVSFPWVGQDESSARVGRRTLRKTAILILTAEMLLLALLSGLYIWRGQAL